MSHYVETMAYAGEIPWHTLGTRLAEDANSPDMMKAAGLDWNVSKGRLFYRSTTQVKDGRPVILELPDAFTMIRSDTGCALDGVTVGKEYTEFQNADLFAFGDALRAQGDVRWHTAGSLKGGRRVWAMAQVAGQFEVRRRSGRTDVTAPFLLLSSSHDGSSSLQVGFTSVRVVCWNTLMAAGAGSFKARHTSSIKGRSEDAIEALGLASVHFQNEAETAQALADTPMDRLAFTKFVAQLLTNKSDEQEALETIAKAKGRSETIIDNKAAELEALFRNGAGNSGSDRYDALNAVTQWIDRGRQRAADYNKMAARVLDSSWFGQGAETKRRALKLLTR